MLSEKLILALDQGTTSSRAIVFDRHANIIALAQEEFTQHYPANGWVEHDPEDIWSSMLRVAQKAMQEAEKKGGQVIAIGITNQRETSLVWEKDSGRAIYNAIVWQDRRTADICEKLKQEGCENIVSERTGLLLDPYFSATKLSWILDNVAGARASAERGELLFGTVDCFLISRFTCGRRHVTDATNASRTSLYNIHSGEWDKALVELFNVPVQMLPEVLDCSTSFGDCDASFFGREIPILGVAGDQQAATFGQACFDPGDIKSTYGTGCFALMNTGKKCVASQHRMLTTVAYQLQGERTYALEGSIFVAGAAVQWLRDGLSIIQSAKECEAMATSLADNTGLYLVPAFTGLGAPYWEADVRGALFGITRATGREALVRATLESVCYQTYDLVRAMSADAQISCRIRVDGGMTANNWLMQFLADIIHCDTERPKITETTALGVAFLAGLAAGVYNSLEDIRGVWKQDCIFTPSMNDELRQQYLSGWKDAVRRLLM